MNMRIVALVAVCFGLASCVSAGKYRTLDKSHADLQKQITDAQSINTKLIEENAARTRELQEIEELKQRQSQEYNNLVGKLQSEVNQGQMKITQFENMLRVDAADKIFFDSGSAEIKDSGKIVLKRLGDALNQMPSKMIRIVGHTDNVRLSKSLPFKDNWDLSVARATSVVRFLSSEAGVAPERMIPSGRSEFVPVAPNDSTENRAKNRRIEIILVEKEAYERTTPKK